MRTNYDTAAAAGGGDLTDDELYHDTMPYASFNFHSNIMAVYICGVRTSKPNRTQPALASSLNT